MERPLEEWMFEFWIEYLSVKNFSLHSSHSAIIILLPPFDVGSFLFKNYTLWFILLFYPQRDRNFNSFSCNSTLSIHLIDYWVFKQLYRVSFKQQFIFPAIQKIMYVYKFYTCYDVIWLKFSSWVELRLNNSVRKNLSILLFNKVRLVKLDGFRCLNHSALNVKVLLLF